MADMNELTLDVTQSVVIESDMATTFARLMERLSTANRAGESYPMPMVLEAYPGGRWYRDLGNDQGHLWGHVQVIKPPTLIEIQGPMFMSYPVAGHLQIRVSEGEGGCKLTLRHQAFGMIQPDHRAGAAEGWGQFTQDVKAMSESSVGAGSN